LFVCIKNYKINQVHLYRTQVDYYVFWQATKLQLN